jgi:glycosyltransferase involved in cell wall biosynthesis
MLPHDFRLAFFTPSLSRLAGGLLWSMRPLCRQLCLTGLNLHVYGGRDSFSREDLPSWAGVPVSVLDVVGPSVFGFQPKLLSEIQSFNPDLLHVHGLWMYPSLASLLASGARRPRIVSPHGMLDPWAVNNSAWKKRIVGALYENRHLRGAMTIHALCDAERDAIRQYGLRNPVAVIPNGIDLPDLGLTLPPPDWKKSIPQGKKVLFFLSRLHPKKGLPALLRAWAMARSRSVSGFTEWCLVIAGWEQGGHQAELELLARDSGIVDSVFFVGPQFGDEKQASLQHSDAFVLPSLSEGLPMAVLEAWSYALPVVMSPQCNLPDGFLADAAVRVEPEVSSLLDGLSSLFSMSDADREAMGQRGLALVRQRFTWEKIGKDMAGVYAWMLGQSARPDCVELD